ncbi:hypothetical protein [Hymenobacter terrenus]|uniref:hypothetical protein n=1 Tax=Hymenobacter terrenus TaxID=1629124 RepID=UPI000619BFA4|nr:hypothetical protein [Hymenobacter terrenus]
MNTLTTKSIDVGCLLAAAVFIAHIVGNLALSRPSGGLQVRVEKLSLFPPAWVFAIWLVIWGLQAVLLFQSYGTGFWTVPVTGLFLLVCLGNIGSQLAGANNLSGAIYLALLGSMLVGAVLFWQVGGTEAGAAPVFEAAAQLYVGWASIAVVVGLGVVLVSDQQLVADATYSRAGLALLVAVPVVLWALWNQGLADYRVVSAPYLLVLLALTIRVVGEGGNFLRSSF